MPQYPRAESHLTVDQPLQQCSECGKTGDLKRCTGCRKVHFCDSKCQTAGWPSHQAFCKAVPRAEGLRRIWLSIPANRRNQQEFSSFALEEPPSPFAEGVLSEALQRDVMKIRTALRRWLLASEECRCKLEAEAEYEALIQSTVNLISLEHQLAPEHAFSTPPKPTFRRVFVSFTKTYWLALLASLDDAGCKELAFRLDLTPPHGVTVPRLHGSKCVERPQELSTKEFEGLMRTIVMVTAEMVPVEVTRSWRELAETGVLLWEENHELKK